MSEKGQAPHEHFAVARDGGRSGHEPHQGRVRAGGSFQENTAAFSGRGKRQKQAQRDTLQYPYEVVQNLVCKSGQKIPPGKSRVLILNVRRKEWPQV